MKKLFFALAGVAMMASSAVAQNYEKNLYGVRAGLNVSNASMSGFDFNSRVGFHVAGIYQRLLTETHPLYLETGLQISQKGFKADFWADKETANPLYLEIPIMVNYKFNIKDVVTLYPSIGFYYALGVSGKSKYEYMETEEFEGESYSEKSDLFGANGVMKRSDFGMRFSATAEWKQFVFSLGYEFGFVNVAKIADGGNPESNEDALSSWGKLKTGNFFLSVGYNF